MQQSGARILFLSGGSALRETSRLLKRHTQNSIHLVTPFDSGGSSARLREAFSMPSVGDLRNRLMALGDEEWPGNAAIFELVNYRFPPDRDAADNRRELDGIVSGEDARLAALPDAARATFLAAMRSFDASRPRDFDLRRAKVGNLALAGGYLQAERRLEPVIERFSELARVLGIVRPIVEADLQLVAELGNGTRVVGQHRITSRDEPIRSPIRKLWLADAAGEPREAAISDATRALIDSAELIVYPPGSFYTSVCANLLPGGVGAALLASDALKVLVPNTTPDPEQLGMRLEDSVAAIERLAGAGAVDAVLCDARKAGPFDPRGVERIDADLLDGEGAIDAERLVAALLDLCRSAAE